MSRIALAVLLVACGDADSGVTTLAPHPLIGPIETVDHFTGTTAVGHGAQFVAFETPAGWYVDSSDPISYGLCGLERPGPEDEQQLRAIQFYTCDVDPPDGTFYEGLVGVVFCDLSRVAPVCSELVEVTGFNAEWAEDPKFPHIEHHGDVFELELDHQRFRLATPPSEPPVDWLALLVPLGVLLALQRRVGT